MPAGSGSGHHTRRSMGWKRATAGALDVRRTRGQAHAAEQTNEKRPEIRDHETKERPGLHTLAWVNTGQYGSRTAIICTIHGACHSAHLRVRQFGRAAAPRAEAGLAQSPRSRVAQLPASEGTDAGS